MGSAAASAAQSGAPALMTQPTHIHLLDIIAIVVGLLCAFYAYFRGTPTQENGNFLLGFGAGTSVVYFIGIASMLWVDASDSVTTIQSNPVLVTGCFVYAALMNIKTLPKPW